MTEDDQVRGRPPLVVWTTLMVLTAALLPMAISVYQLRTNSDALLEQVQVTHMVAATAAAARIDSHLARLEGLAASLAEQPSVRVRPQDPEAQTLLRATLAAEPQLLAIAAYDAGGSLIVRARRKAAPDELGATWDALPAAAADASVVASADGRWLRLRAELDAGAQLYLVAAAAPATAAVTARELGDSVRLVLIDDRGRPLAGDPRLLDDIAPEHVAAATSGALEAGAGIDRDAAGDHVWALAPLASAPWSILSYQDAAAAEIARRRIRTATAIGVGGAVLLTAVFAVAVYGALVRPLRRVIRTQRRLAGLDEQVLRGSEVDQLEASLDQLSERLRDREDLGEVFLGRYQVLDLAGTGSSSSVFRGWDPKLERPVALKTVRLDRKSPDDVARRHRQTDRLLGEAVSHARFVHPNIVTLYDLVDTGRAAFIAMELVDGASLDRYLRAYAPLPPDQIIALGLAVARALDVAHRDNLVHQDIKPGNILLGTDGSVKVADFGISQLTPLAARSDDSISGTPGYLPPESLEGRGYTPRSDLFALGVVLYEAATGRHPFRSHRQSETLLRTLEIEPRRIDEIRPEIPPRLATLIQQLLAKDPRLRPPSAADVASTLEAIAGAQPVVWQPQPLPSRRGEGSASRSSSAGRFASTATAHTLLRPESPGPGSESSDQNST